MLSLIEQALVFIGSAILLVPIFHRLGFGSVLGYLLAGIIIGPFGLKFISDSQSVLHFAEFGVVLLLFIIGLEIQPQKLWSMRKLLIQLGSLQVILTTAVFTAIGTALGFSLLHSVILSFALSLSSTAFALQTLIEKKQLKTEFGISSFTVLLTQDLFAIPALAVIPLIASKSSVPTENAHQASSWSFVYFVGILIFLFLMSRFFIRPFFRLIAGLHSREMFTAVTLFIVLGVATLMTKIGLSAALGTFIAGVLLADNEYRHELEADLDPFKSLFMGLFFISVGMTVNLNLILKNPFLIFSLAIVYLTLKFVLIYTSSRINKFSSDTARLTALNICQGGEFAFVIFGIILTHSLIDSKVIETLTAIITISMALSPLLLYAHENWICRKQIQNSHPVYDEVQNESPQVIIAGFGRFGQIFGRILRSQNIPFVAIDHDPSQIELVRKFGNTVYYGDAGRLDLLESAGAKTAKYFILAIDDPETSTSIAETVKNHFPNLKIFARARNRGHVFDLMALGLTHIKRETFDSSVLFVGELFKDMGYSSTRANMIVEKFKAHDESMLQEQFKVRNDDKQFVSVSQQGQAQLAEVLSKDQFVES